MASIDSEKVKKIIDSKIAILDKQFDIDKIVDVIINNIEKFYQELLVKTANLDPVKKQKIIATEVNKFETELDRMFAENKSYKTELTNYLRNFDRIQVFNNEIFKTVNNLDTSEINKWAKPEQKRLTNYVIEQMTGAKMNVQFVKSVTQAIYSNVLLGTPLKDMIDYVKKNSIEGLRGYADQVTIDALREYDGSVSAMTADYFGLDSLKYVGSIIKTSRKQCRRWVAMGTIPLKKLQKEIDWAYDNGSGMIPGTTPQNFMSKCGGYRCRHTAIPFMNE